MPVLVTCNFDDDLMKNEPASMETACEIFITQGQLHNEWADSTQNQT